MLHQTRAIQIWLTKVCVSTPEIRRKTSLKNRELKHFFISVRSPDPKLVCHDPTKKIFLVRSPGVNGCLVRSLLPKLGRHDPTKFPLTLGDPTKNFFLVRSPGPNLVGADPTKMIKCIGS